VAARFAISQNTLSSVRSQINADQRTQARTVDVVDLRQVQHNALVSGMSPRMVLCTRSEVVDVILLDP
jgi:hypothetical protein